MSEQTDYDPDRVVIRDKRRFRADGTPVQADPSAAAPAPEPEEPALAEQSEDARLLEERTADLQRLQAEYANYRRRTERDRLVSGELAVGGVLAALLPVLDDIERARMHGDLTGALKSVADQLDVVLGKFGLVQFASVGDPFDPNIHEAVTHDESADVELPTATMIMRRGYRHGERLLRPAMVGVTDPTDASAPAE